MAITKISHKNLETDGVNTNERHQRRNKTVLVQFYFWLLVIYILFQCIHINLYSQSVFNLNTDFKNFFC